MNFSGLKTEVQTDPAGIGYGSWASAADDLRIAGLINDATKRTIARTLVPSWEVAGAFDATEYAALTQIQLSRLAPIVSGTVVNAQNVNIRTILAAIFPQGGPTRTALLALQSQTVSRATELGFAAVLVGELTTARVNY